MEGDNVLCVSLQRGEGGGHIDYGLSVTYNPMHDGITSPSPTLPKGEGDIYDLNGRKIMEQGAGGKGIFVKQNKKVILK